MERFETATAGQPTGVAQRSPEIAVATDDERADWAVVSLSGALETRADAELLGDLLCDLVVDNRLISIDAREVERLGPAAHRVLAAAAPVFRRCGGVVVISGLDPRDRLALRILDLRRELLLVSR